MCVRSKGSVNQFICFSFFWAEQKPNAAAIRMTSMEEIRSAPLIFFCTVNNFTFNFSLKVKFCNFVMFKRFPSNLFFLL